MTTPDLLPEGALIEQARTNRQPKLSVRAAAQLAGISEGWWRQVVRGYRTVKGGARVDVDAPADTLAAMADVVDVTPTQLREVGRADAARQLDLLHQSRGPEKAWSGDLAEVPDSDLLDEIRRRLADRAGQGEGFPDLRVVARQVDPEDPSTFGGDD